MRMGESPFATQGVMAGLDPAIYLPATGVGGSSNRVDARVTPAHDDILLVPSKICGLGGFLGPAPR
jgi:hypothetical protein